MPRVNLAKQNGAYFKRDLCAQLDYLRKKAKVKQSDIAKEWGCTQPNVSIKIANGDMSVEEFAHMAKMIHMTSEEIGELIAYWE